MSDYIFQPLGNRVLIVPDERPTQTASGLHLAETWAPDQTGTVVAVGCPTHPRRQEALILAEALDVMSTQGEMGLRKQRLLAAARLLREVTAIEAPVKVGDHVVFSWQHGQELRVNDGEARYLMMSSEDLLAVVEPSKEPVYV